ncbi:hypothetical protein ASN18_3339 [Candidatus Magnetominusculus xianensis]|uniref:Uncharacterized protein n=1 Tax=Candidatus Magnetominusculus xianensis TaxID=1748249 RepID=A0ABR5SAQ7_9BACT|nr:hypothetical protein ASN18_3339 [Candidatus Magnetominusculus xianensis]
MKNIRTCCNIKRTNFVLTNGSTIILKGNVIQLELFNEKICEIEDGAVRYIFKKKPMRVEELERMTIEKIHRVQEMTVKQNDKLDNHPRAKDIVAIKKIEDLIMKLKMKGLITVEQEGRKLFLSIKDD